MANPDYVVRRLDGLRVDWPDKLHYMYLNGLTRCAYEGKGRGSLQGTAAIHIEFNVPSCALLNRLDYRMNPSFETQTADFVVDIMEYQVRVNTQPEVQTL